MLVKILCIFYYFNLIQITYQELNLPPTVFRENSACECGKTQEDIIATRIVGGTITDEKKYPWMVAIMSHGKMHCGGSLISDRYVLTAGHCLNWVTKSDLTVLLKMKDRLLFERENKGGVKYEIDNIFVHEDFTSDYLHDTNDIGLIKLKTAVKLDEATPVCLPPPDFDYNKRIGVITGWGRTSQGGATSRLLQRANVHLISNEDCMKITSVGEHIKDTMFCAYEKGIDACQGDSGGPLTYESKEDNKVIQIGLVSWGIGCAKPGIPGIYTRITSYLEWIGLHTKDSLFCKNANLTTKLSSTNLTFPIGLNMTSLGSPPLTG